MVEVVNNEDEEIQIDREPDIEIGVSHQDDVQS